jgi:hypothetical protein
LVRSISFVYIFVCTIWMSTFFPGSMCS